ncbi:MAG: HAD hydrolase family protein [Clostridiales bacterium]|nr:HAD hydrolase family protein [Clostridiales bacterium]
MKRRAFFFDLDGTLAIHNGPVSSADRRALELLREAGQLRILCTGRTTGYLYEPVLALGFDGIVAGAGSHITLGDRLLYRRQVSPALCRRLAEAFLALGQPCIFEGEREMLLLGMEGYAGFDWPVIRSPEDFDRLARGVTVNKLSLFGELRPGAAELLAPDLTLIPNLGYAEAVPAGCCKSDGMRRLLAAVGLAREDSVAFGDSGNDRDMLSFAGIGIAMGNAPEEVKASADFVTGTLVESGVSSALINLGFIHIEE